MPNLKDIKTRIESVKTTRQVTSAMKMVSAAKLKKAQDDIVKVRPYADKLNEMSSIFVACIRSKLAIGNFMQMFPDIFSL